MEFIPALKPTPEIPLLQGWRLDFIKSLKDNASPIHLMTLFPRIFREVQNSVKHSKVINLSTSRDSFGSATGVPVESYTWELFHCIPRSVLQSVVLGTVAYDNSRPGADALKGYFSNGSGIYVIGVSVADRSGKFLNRKEYRVLVSNLTTYIKEASTSLHNKQQPPSVLIQKTDRMYGEPADPSKPRFTPDAGGLDNARRLLRSVKERYDALKSLDPSGDVYSIQSPLYVGCSKSVSDRLKDYTIHQNKGSLGTANKMLGLLVSLMGYQGLKPKLHFITAIRVWEDGQLSQAEMLVTLLASAYITQEGFNVTAAGQTKDGGFSGEGKEERMLESKQYVLGSTEHFTNNIEHSAADCSKLMQASDLQQEFEGIGDIPLDDWEQSETAKRQAETELKERLQTLDLKTEIAKARAELAELTKQTEKLTEVKEVLQCVERNGDVN
ncbi:hypothetical protein QBC42DRAFT_256854 [Cladorrhinum samala]|uniref:Uncharacterized protein n=1 Tax=Cladorrhinum samala TaxID=585594 RepID=A0AAV9H820_9PEZI|nr:hypothetical protein QBC42DRAFT_256854 [Cladorrhinum samala]